MPKLQTRANIITIIEGQISICTKTPNFNNAPTGWHALSYSWRMTSNFDNNDYGQNKRNCST